MEQTLIILKPDSMQRGLVGQVISRFENIGLKIVAAKVISPTTEQFYYHYETIGKMISRRGQDAFDATLEFMLQGPVMLMVLEGIEAVEIVRKLVGTTEPKSAKPGTIRGDYSHVSFNYANALKLSIPNLIHASGDDQEAELEISHWFNKAEIFNYVATHDKFTLNKYK